MTVLLSALIVLGIITALVTAVANRHNAKKVARGELTEMPDDTVRRIQDMECCGQHEVCEKEALLKAINRDVEYYDDEDLDQYIGRAADSYNDDEEEDFRDVLYTMNVRDVRGWVRSLQLRGIELPPDVRQEALFVMQDH